MIGTGWQLALATVTGAVGIWLMLPRGGARGRLLGALLGAVALGLLAGTLPPLENLGAQSLFWVLAGVTVASAAAAVTFRSAVYCAVWFGLTLLGTAGLLFFQGAQFLGVATVVVYAGAILVTLLFVLMLASQRGETYDRLSWEAPLAASAGMVMVGILTMTVSGALDPQGGGRALAAAAPGEAGGGVLAESHMAHLGSELFSRHLVAVEVAGTLLLVALVGAVAMVAHARAAQAAGAEEDKA